MATAPDAIRRTLVAVAGEAVADLLPFLRVERPVESRSALLDVGPALVAAYVGFHAEPTIEGTSVATTRAVVNASLLVLMFNFVLSALLFQ